MADKPESQQGTTETAKVTEGVVRGGKTFGEAPMKKGFSPSKPTNVAPPDVLPIPPQPSKQVQPSQPATSGGSEGTGNSSQE